MCIYDGNYTTLHNENETDAFFKVMSIIQRGITFELGKKYQMDIDYMANPKKKMLVVIVKGNKPVLIMRMLECEKVSFETLLNNDTLLREFDLAPDEWTAVLANDKKLHIMGPKKRVYKYRMELSSPEDTEECRKFFEVGLELLQNIQ